MNPDDAQAIAAMLRAAWPQISDSTVKLWLSHLEQFPMAVISRAISHAIDADTTGRVPPLGTVKGFAKTMVAEETAQQQRMALSLEHIPRTRQPWFIQLQMARLRVGNHPGSPLVELMNVGHEKVRADCAAAGESIATAFDSWWARNGGGVEAGGAIAARVVYGADV